MGIEINIKEYLRHRSIEAKFIDEIKHSSIYFETLAAYRAFYLRHEEELMLFNEKYPNKWFILPPIDLMEQLTPIEASAFHEIRYRGNPVLYPQYPVLNFTLDFGNPVKKIGLELDGKQYHNRKRDYERDKKLDEVGWKIYRITGKEMLNLNYEELSLDERFDDLTPEEFKLKANQWILDTGAGVLEAINTVHFKNRIINDGYRDNYYYQLCKLTLKNHKLI